MESGESKKGGKRRPLGENHPGRIHCVPTRGEGLEAKRLTDEVNRPSSKYSFAGFGVTEEERGEISGENVRADGVFTAGELTTLFRRTKKRGREKERRAVRDS